MALNSDPLSRDTSTVRDQYTAGSRSAYDEEHGGFGGSDILGPTNGQRRYEEHGGFGGSDILGPTNGQRRSCLSGCGARISQWAARNPKTANAMKYTAIAALIITVLGAGLLAYMHFSGLGISKAGFIKLGAQIKSGFVLLGHKISALMAKPANMNIGQLLYKVVLPTVGGSVLLTVIAFKGKAMKNACQRKVQARRQQFREWNAHRAEASSRQPLHVDSSLLGSDHSS